LPAARVHILVMSNGAFGGVHERLLAALQTALPQSQQKETP